MSLAARLLAAQCVSGGHTVWKGKATFQPASPSSLLPQRCVWGCAALSLRPGPPAVGRQCLWPGPGPSLHHAHAAAAPDGQAGVQVRASACLVRAKRLAQEEVWLSVAKRPAIWPMLVWLMDNLGCRCAGAAVLPALTERGAESWRQSVCASSRLSTHVMLGSLLAGRSQPAGSCARCGRR